MKYKDLNSSDEDEDVEEAKAFLEQAAARAKRNNTRKSNPNAAAASKNESRPNGPTRGLSILLEKPGMNAPELRSNLMREQYDTDPLFYYEVVGVLGVGSMGSVTHVKKRNKTVGGSARKSIQNRIQKKKLERDCLSIPLIGPMMKYLCLFCPASDDAFADEGQSSRGLVTDAPLKEMDCPNNLTAPQLLQNSQIIQQQQEASKNKKARFQLNGNDDDDHAATTTNHAHEHIYAMKSIHLDRVHDEDFINELRNEIQILKKLDHPHIVRPIETFEYLKTHKIFMIMELCTGGDLYSRDPYTEQEAARIVSCILSAISYMHSKNIAHRDLKYENVLFVDHSPQSIVKLIDFGLSSKYSSDDPNLTGGVGTIYTMAPEVIKGNYTKQADLWSVGVITYMLLSSQMPFYGKKRRHIIELILSANFTFRGRRWKYISNQAKEFVKDLLVYDPDERITADEAFKSFWLSRRKEYRNTMRNANLSEEYKISESIIKFTKYSKLKKLALMIVAHKATSDDIGILRKVFEKYDNDKSGDLSYSDFKKAFANSGFSNKQIMGIYKALDLDGTGQITYTEFLAATIEFQGAIPEEYVAEAFDRLDCDDSGYITKENLKAILGSDYPTSEIDGILTESAALTKLSNPNRISYPEFLALWCTSTPETEASITRANYRNNSTELDAGYFGEFDSDADDSDEDFGDEDDATDTFRDRREMFLETKKIHLQSTAALHQHEIPDSDKREFIDGDDVQYIQRTTPKLPPLAEHQSDIVTQREANNNNNIPQVGVPRQQSI